MAIDYAEMMAKGQYQAVLEESEGKTKPNDLFYRIAALLALNRGKEAMTLCLRYRESLYQANPLLMLKTNFELRFALGEFDEAYADAEIFANYPYVSQEVEEYLRSLSLRIRSAERASLRPAVSSPEEVEAKLLHPKDPYEALSYLANFQDADTLCHASTLSKVLATSPSNLVKTYALLLLSKAKYGEEVTFSKNGKTYHLIPKDLIPPYEEVAYRQFLSRLDRQLKDPSLSSVAHDLANNYCFELFPEPFLHEKNDETLYLWVFESLAHDYLRSPWNEEKEALLLGISYDEAKKRKGQVETVLNQAERLKV